MHGEEICGEIEVYRNRCSGENSASDQKSRNKGSQAGGISLLKEQSLYIIYININKYIYTHTHARTRARAHTHTHTHTHTQVGNVVTFCEKKEIWRSYLTSSDNSSVNGSNNGLDTIYWYARSWFTIIVPRYVARISNDPMRVPVNPEIRI